MRKSVPGYVFLTICLLGLPACETTKSKHFADPGFCGYSDERIDEKLDLAEAGDLDAQYLAARWYADGNCVPKDFSKAEYWYLRTVQQGETHS